MFNDGNLERQDYVLSCFFRQTQIKREPPPYSSWCSSDHDHQLFYHGSYTLEVRPYIAPRTEDNALERQNQSFSKNQNCTLDDHLCGIGIEKNPGSEVNVLFDQVRRRQWEKDQEKKYADMPCGIKPSNIMISDQVLLNTKHIRWLIVMAN